MVRHHQTVTPKINPKAQTLMLARNKTYMYKLQELIKARLNGTNTWEMTELQVTAQLEPVRVPALVLRKAHHMTVHLTCFNYNSTA